MSGARALMIARRARTLRSALAGLAGVLRDADDPHAVRIHITSPDGEYSYGSLCLGVLPLTELVDAARQRALDIARVPEATATTQPNLHLITDHEKRTQ